MPNPLALPLFGELPMPPIEILNIEFVPESRTPGHVPAGFILMEDQINCRYLVPTFMVKYMESAARGNNLRESVVKEEVEVRCHTLQFALS